jgi:hypothetical protein
MFLKDLLLVMSIHFSLLVHIQQVFFQYKGQLNYDQNNLSILLVESVIKVHCDMAKWYELYNVVNVILGCV